MDDQRVKKQVMTRIEFPSNSHTLGKQIVPNPPNGDPTQDPSRKLARVTTGAVVQRKKSLGKRFLETFVSEDVGDVRRYIVHDVLIPALKNTLIEMIHGGSEMMFSDRSRGNNRTRRSGNQSHVSYNNISSGRNNGRNNQTNSRSITMNDFGDIVVDNRGEAEAVLSVLVDQIIDYGQATVSDLYQAVGVTANYTDDKYGWYELNRATVSRVRDGYAINLPKPVLLT